MAKNKLDMTKVVARWKKAKEQLPKLLTNVSKNTFVDSWKKQGWDGEKWKEVKRRTPGTRAYNSATKAARTRAILVQSGALRRSIVINSQTFARMVISTNVPYAQSRVGDRFITEYQSLQTSKSRPIYTPQGLKSEV